MLLFGVLKVLHFSEVYQHAVFMYIHKFFSGVEEGQGFARAE
jgi:hypothetical protein